MQVKARAFDMGFRDLGLREGFRELREGFRDCRWLFCFLLRVLQRPVSALHQDLHGFLRPRRRVPTRPLERTHRCVCGLSLVSHRGVRLLQCWVMYVCDGSEIMG